MVQQQHRSALVATIDRESDEVDFSIPKGIFEGRYLIQEENDLKTVEEIDNPRTKRAVRLLWEGESVTETHLETLTARLLYRTVAVP